MPPMNRREFLAGPSAYLIGATLGDGERVKRSFKAVAFDGFTLLDPRPITAALERKFPGHGSQIADVWRARLFDYQWLRALGGQYAGFLECATDSLRAVR